jgi:hypothetical protein
MGMEARGLIGSRPELESQVIHLRSPGHVSKYPGWTHRSAERSGVHWPRLDAF